MFTWLNKQGVRSDQGFIVQTINRFVIRYTENLGAIDVSVEYGRRGNQYFVYVYEKEFYQWNDGKKISEEKKIEVLNNFIEAMKFQDIDVEVQ